MGEKLPEFSDAYLQVDEGFIYGKSGEWAIILTLKPFELDDERVKTKIVFDAFPWKVKQPVELGGKTFHYTEGQREEAGIEGSIYLGGAHHPVDVRRIVFSNADAQTIEVTFHCDLVFESEDAGFANRPAEIRCRLQCKPPKGGYRVIE